MSFELKKENQKKKKINKCCQQDSNCGPSALRLPGERSTHYTTGSDDIVIRKLRVKKKEELKARGFK